MYNIKKKHKKNTFAWGRETYKSGCTAFNLLLIDTKKQLSGRGRILLCGI